TTNMNHNTNNHNIGFNRLHQSSLPSCHALTQSPQQQQKQRLRRHSHCHSHHRHIHHHANKASRAPYNSNVYILSSSYDNNNHKNQLNINNHNNDSSGLDSPSLISLSPLTLQPNKYEELNSIPKLSLPAMTRSESDPTR